MSIHDFALLFFLTLLISCSNPGENINTITRRPEYFLDFKIGEVRYGESVGIPNVTRGAYKDYILKLEPYKGVHLMQNKNDSIDILFWDIPGITDFTVIDSILTFKMMKDEFKIDISDEQKPRLYSKISTSEVHVNSLSPYKMEGSFECVDPSQGYIKNWINEVVFDPKCWK